jgi:hypothetical protein
VGRKRRSIALAVTASEKAIINVSGYLDAGGINARLKPVASSVALAGGGTLVTVALSKVQAARALADLRHRRSPKLHLTVSGVDPAGNTSKPRHLTIWLRR